MEWQPIETAPKDGTKILIWDDLNGEHSIAFFHGDEDRSQFNGWFHVNDWVGGARFSKWMPLPAPPKQD